MEQINVIRKDGTVYGLFKKNPFSAVTQAVQNFTLMGDDNVQLTIKSSEMIDFSIGDKIIVGGDEYSIRSKATREILSDGIYSYDVVFYGVMYELMRSQYRDADANGKSAKSTFPLTYSLKDFVKVIIYNVSRDYPGIWLFDEEKCPETEPQTIQFSKQNCLQVLQNVCKQFDYEFRIDQNNGVRTIRIGQFGGVVSPPGGKSNFEWGRGNGLYRLKEQKIDDKSIITRLWIEGGTKNLKSDYRGYSDRLQIPYPKRLNQREHKLSDGTIIAAGSQMIGTDDDSKRYIEDTSLRNQIGSIEDTEYFEDIHPTRTGIVSSLGEDIYSFVDNSMDFDLNEKDANGNTKWLVNGVSVKINFITGRLAGQQFELKEKKGYDHSTKTFSIIKYTDERGLSIPTEDSEAYRISAGDKYRITDINLPDSYVNNAEEDLWYAGYEKFLDSKQPRAQYVLTFDRMYFINSMPSDSDTAVFRVGDYVPVKDIRFNLEKNIRIQKMSRNLLLEHDYTLTLSDITTISIQTQTILDVLDHNVIIQTNNLRDINKARRSWRTTEELRNMVYDTDGYFDIENIRPNSIDTNMLTVGSKSQQFILKDSILQANYNGQANVFSTTSGQLIHLALEDEGGNPRIWNVAGGNTTLSDSNGYYVFAKCSKNDNTGIFYITQEQIKFENDSDPNNYYFQVGIIGQLNLIDNFRDFTTTYGFTRINGNTINTGRIQSSGGSGSFFDLDENQFRIGTQNRGLSWNIDNNGQLILKGTLVQSQTGDTQPLGYFRGEYNISYTYYEGDEVTYQGSTYRFIYPTPQTGKLPTDTTYWIVKAEKGDPGTNGEASDWKTFAYKKSASKPNSPTDTTSIPSGWQDYPDSEATGNDKWWMVVAIVHWTGSSWVAGTFVNSTFVPGQWSEPIAVTGEQGTDGQYVDFKFYATPNLNAPTWNSTLANMLNPTGWLDQPPTLPASGAIWMIEAWKQAGGTQLIAQWSTPVRISGEKGQDGISPYYLDLDNENASVAADYNGNPVAATYPSCNVRLYLGSEQVTVGVTFKYVVSGCTINVTTGSYISNSAFTLTGLSADKATVTVTARVGGVDVMSDVMSITKVKAGSPGADAIIYWLQPSVSAIKRSASGTITPATITCEAFQRVGAGSVQTAQNVTIRYRYETTAGLVSVHYNYSEAITIASNIACIDFFLYDSGNNLLDKERVPIVVDGSNGTNGTDGAFFEYRYQKYGSPDTPPSLSTTSDNPSGWTTTMPTLGALEYLWMTVAKKNANGTLYSGSSWSPPCRASGVKGDKGDVGENGKSPALAFRGLWQSGRTYYGTTNRVDAIFHQESGSGTITWMGYIGKFYVARVDAGNGFNVEPPNSSKWNEFGAQFESIATGLLLADIAYIKNLIVDRFASASGINYNPNTDSLMLSKSNKIVFLKYGADEAYNADGSINTTKSLVTIGQDVGLMQAAGGNRPGIMIRDYYGDGKVTELTSAGLFTNGSKITGIAASTGISSSFSIASLLQSRVAGSTYNKSINAAVFGNDQTGDDTVSEGYGGYFNKLKADGLYFGIQKITDSNITSGGGYVGISKSAVLLLAMNSSNAGTIWLGNAEYNGRIIFVKNVSTGGIGIRAYDSTTPIYTNSNIGTNTVTIARGDCYMCIYSENNWFVNKMGV